MRFLFFFSQLYFSTKEHKKQLSARVFFHSQRTNDAERTTRFFARVNNERERETLFGVDFVRLFLFSREREREREFFLER